jgi:nitroreductase
MKSQLYFKKWIPSRFWTTLRELKMKFLFKKLYRNDYRHLKKRYRDSSMEKIRLLGNITKLYHRIEKGLSYEDFRFGFGYRTIIELIGNLNQYYKWKFEIENIRVKTALNVLCSYIDRHLQSNIDVSYIVEKLKINLEPYRALDYGGITKYSSTNVIRKSKINFYDLTQSRHSVRFFNTIPPDINKIYRSIEMSQKTPSVCNRQGWKIHLVTDPHLIDIFKKVHNGFSLKEQNLTTFILITFQKDYFSYPLERNQGFIDGGLISMSLLYSLTYEGLATCALNANLSIEGESKIRDSMGITLEEGLIMFIAVGNYPETFISPKSKRDQINDVLVEHNESK